MGLYMYIPIYTCMRLTIYGKTLSCMPASVHTQPETLNHMHASVDGDSSRAYIGPRAEATWKLVEKFEGLTSYS